MKMQQLGQVKIVLVFVLVFLAGCSEAQKTTKQFPVYEPSWESLNQHEIPQWLLDAKIGLYGHWGIYSIPAFKTEWYGRLMYDKQTRGDAVVNHHIEKYGKLEKSPVRFRDTDHLMQIIDRIV